MRFRSPASVCRDMGLSPFRFYQVVYPRLPRLRGGGRTVILDMGSEANARGVVKKKALRGLNLVRPGSPSFVLWWARRT